MNTQVHVNSLPYISCLDCGYGDSATGCETPGACQQYPQKCCETCHVNGTNGGNNGGTTSAPTAAPTPAPTTAAPTNAPQPTTAKPTSEKKSDSELPSTHPYTLIVV